MRTTLLLAAAAALALTAGEVTAAPATTVSAMGAEIVTSNYTAVQKKTLWDQNNNANGYFVSSQNYTSGVYTSFNDQAADDFVVPSGKVWIVTEVDVTGRNVGVGPPTFETVVFYKDNKGIPGAPVKNGTFNVQESFNEGSFVIPLGTGVKLRAGKYWVSVVANEAAELGGFWQWEENSTTKKYEAVWQNPAGGAGNCETWGTLANCTGSPIADLMFALQGRSK